MKVLIYTPENHSILTSTMKRLLLFIILLNVTGANAQTNLYVDSSVAASGIGTSWTTAYKSLNEALLVVNNTITSSYIVHVAKGTYYPTVVQSYTNRDDAFLINRGAVNVFGGYPNGGGTRNPAANPTVLSGNIGSSLLSTDNSYHVLVLTNTALFGDTIHIDGFKIVDGYANGAGSFGTVVRNAGAGLYINGGFQTTFLYNCLFSRDSSTGDGGAIALSAAKATLIACALDANAAGGSGGAVYGPSGSANAVSATNTSFSNNTAINGGAIANLNPSAALQIFSNCSFVNNKAAQNGGAIYQPPTGTGYGTVIRQTKFIGNAAQNGGAIYINHSYTLSKDTFSTNSATGAGGGVFTTANAATSTIDTNLFISNRANTGGGIYFVPTGFTNTTLYVTGSTFLNDTAITLGGGMYFGASPWGILQCRHCILKSNYAMHGGGIYGQGDLTISQNIISGNTATQNGGGIYYKGGNLNPTNTFINTLFSGNKAGGNGGALYDTSAAAKLQLTFCTFAGDTAATANGIYNTGFAVTNIFNSIIWDGAGNIVNVSGGSSNASYSIIQSGHSGTNVSTANPLFVTPVAASAAPTASGDYQLLPCSPAINSGQSFTGVPAQDLVDNSRLYGSGYDMGVYETQPLFPAPIAGGTSVCVGDILQLNNVFTGGTWSSSNTAVATINSSGVVSGNSAGTDTVTYYYVKGPCSMTVTQIITVKPTPVVPSIVGANTVCVKDTIHLSNTGTGGYWISNNPYIATINSTGTVNGVKAGNDTIVYYITNAANGCTGKSLKVITVTGVDNTITQNGAQLTANQIGSAYQWLNCDSGNAPVAGQTAQSFMPTMTGQYAVALSLNGCRDTSNCISVSITSTGIVQQEITKHKITIHPNPVSTWATIIFSSCLSERKIIIRDMAGQALKQMISKENIIVFDVSALSKGIYIVEVQESNSTFHDRLMIVH